MATFIINENATIIKNILVDESIIYVSDENYETKEFFLEKVNNTKKSILDTHFIIDTNNIIKFIPTESDFAIQLFFTVKNKKEKTYFEFNSLEEYNSFLNYLINKTHFTLQNELKNNFSSWFKKAMYTIIAGIIFIIIYTNAISLENGETITISGKRRWLQRLMGMIAEKLGSTNTLIVGVLVIIAFSFWTYNAYKKGKKITEVYKK